MMNDHRMSGDEVVVVGGSVAAGTRGDSLRELLLAQPLNPLVMLPVKIVASLPSPMAGRHTADAH